MIQRPRGTRDFGPDEMSSRRGLELMLREQARLFGFEEIATPMFESTELFTTKSGPNIVEEIYAFEDKGGRPISLRPELTAPVMRFFVNELSNTPRPLKLFYFGQCFRYERPQAGRYREFFQFGAEIVGSANAETDAEAIALAATMIRRTGLSRYGIRVGHIGVLRGMLADAGVDATSMAPVLQKLDKKDHDTATELMTSAGVSGNDVEAIIDLTGTVGNVDVLESLDHPAATYLREVFDALDPYGVMDLRVDLGVVRGLDYYTGLVFEGDAPSLGAESQILGGGSYGLSELFGGERVFSTGFAIGFDRLMLALSEEGIAPAREGVCAYVIPVNDAVRERALGIAAHLRISGVPTDVDLMRRKMGKSMKHADSIGARHAVIVGERELASGSVTVRDMSTGDQELVPLDSLADRVG